MQPKASNQAKQSPTDALKTSAKRVIQKTTEETVYLIRNNIIDIITKVSTSSLQNNSETFTNEHGR